MREHFLKPKPREDRSLSFSFLERAMMSEEMSEEERTRPKESSTLPRPNVIFGIFGIVCWSWDLDEEVTAGDRR